MSTVLSQNDKQMKEIVEQNLRDYFRSHYSDIEKARHCITFPHDSCNNEAKAYELNLHLQHCKVLLVTANSVEQSALTRYLSSQLKESSSKTSLKFVDRFVVDAYNYQIATYTCKAGSGDIKFAHLHAANIASNTDGGSKDAVLAALKRFRPNLVISLGCAYGWDPSQNYGQKLGDVLLSKELIAYSEKNKRINNKLTFKSDVIHPISTELKPYLQTYEEEHAWASDTFKVYYGSLLTGGSVLSDADEKARIEDAASHHDRVPIGGEMEGAGLRKACEEQKNKVPWLVIKGISDWGMEKNTWDSILEAQAMDEVNTERLSGEEIKKAIQVIATEHAFDTMLKILEHNPQLYRDDSLLNLSRIQDKSFSWLKDVRMAFGSWKARLLFSRWLKLLVGVMLTCLSSLGIYLKVKKSPLIYDIYSFSLIFGKESELMNRLFVNIMLCGTLFIGLLFIYSALRFTPFQLSKEFARFEVYKSNELILKNADNYSLYQVELMWIDYVRIRPALISQQLIQCLRIKETISLKMPDPLTKALCPQKEMKGFLKTIAINIFCLFRRTVLQLFYFTPDNSCYFHMFVFINPNTYLEKVFRVEESKCKLCASYRKVLIDIDNHHKKKKPDLQSKQEK